ncbi:FG-GAP repeat-containing protein [Pedococcus cremeus]|uniref:FG-GAP repeat-containing protein n=1 Tax=Pedococcus cremeus TaxID=587636 RepID=A0A1H9TH77_9MICO|nr:FG-GAP repeat protein [Pedococcus cremeus]SER95963.1 FG-GAP repeat-containing protein [Pedococcus cremeus]
MRARSISSVRTKCAKPLRSRLTHGIAGAMCVCVAGLSAAASADAFESAPLAASTARSGLFVQQGPKLTAGDESGPGEFGGSVSVSADGNTALVGGSGDSSGGGAAWVFTRAGGVWAQQGSKLTPSNVVGQARFGTSVSLSADGNTALVGGYGDSGSGAAWVFTRSGGTWKQAAKVTANDEAGAGAFGANVALSADGGTAAVVALFDNNYSGAAWIFTRSGGTWTQQGPKLTASDETRTEEAGGAGLASVALSADGDVALLGGTRDNGFMGAAWVFTRSGGKWTQLGPKFTPTDETLNRSEFGSSVALSADGGTALIGGPFDDTGAGAVWGFARSGANWVQQGPKLTPAGPTGYRYFGASVALSADGTTAAIGAPFDDSFVGAAWTFGRSGAGWLQHGGKLTASDESGQGQLGSVSLSADGKTLLVGGSRDNNAMGAAWVFSPILVGSQQVQPAADSNPAGMAEAFRYTAVGTGAAGKVSVYLDSTSAATSVTVGLYTNTSSGDPGTLLTTGTIATPQGGAWNTITVPAAPVTAGTDYWLAVLAPRKAGTLTFRDLPGGTGGPAQTSAHTSLTSLPTTWKTGTRFANSPASLLAAP